MKDIKTKDAAKKDIKVLDKTGNLAKAVRDVSVRTKDQIENLIVLVFDKVLSGG